MKKMTKGSPARLIIAFAIPMLIGNIFQQLYSMADMFIVGHTISSEALGAIGCTGSISMLLIHFSQGLTGGFCILTARYFGADDERNVRKSFATGLFLSFLCIVLLTTLGLGFLKPFMRLIKTREELFSDAFSYIQIVVAGIGATILYNYFAGILRAFGDSRSPLYVLIAASLVNVGLDYLLILVFRMGVQGAALATVTSQLLSAVLCLILILKKLPMLRLRKEDLQIEGAAVKQHLTVGVPMAFQWSLISIGQIVMQSALNQLSTDAVTAFSAASKIDLFALMPSMSFSSAMTAYVPQNYGARDPKRIRAGVRTCCLIAGSFCMTVGIVKLHLWRNLRFLLHRFRKRSAHHARPALSHDHRTLLFHARAPHDLPQLRPGTRKDLFPGSFRDHGAPDAFSDRLRFSALFRLYRRLLLQPPLLGGRRDPARHFLLQRAETV